MAYTKAEWAAIQAGKNMAEAYGPAFARAWPDRSPKPDTSGMRGEAGEPGPAGQVGTPAAPLTYKRGARTTEEQLAMLRGGNQAAMQLQEYGRYVSDTAPGKSKMSKTAKASYNPTYGEDMFKLSAAIRGAPSDLVDIGTGAPDANYDRLAASVIAKNDAYGRELMSEYGMMAKDEMRRQAQVRSTLDPVAFDDASKFAGKIAGGSNRAVSAFASRAALASISKEDMAGMQAGKALRRVQAAVSANMPEGWTAPKFEVGADGKLFVANEAALNEEQKARSKQDAQKAARAVGGTVETTITSDGRESYRISMPSERNPTQDEIARAKWARAFGGGTFQPTDFISATGVQTAVAPRLAERAGIAGDKADGVVVDSTNINAAEVNAIADVLADLVTNRGANGAQSEAELWDKAIDARAEALGVTAEEYIKKLGGSENAIEDTLLTAMSQATDSLDREAATRAEAAITESRRKLASLGVMVTGEEAANLIGDTLLKVNALDKDGVAMAAKWRPEIAGAKDPFVLAGVMSEFLRLNMPDDPLSQDAQMRAIGELVGIARRDPEVISRNADLMAQLRAGASKYSAYADEEMAALTQRAGNNQRLRGQILRGEVSFDKKSGLFMDNQTFSVFSSMGEQQKQAFLDMAPRDQATSFVGVQRYDDAPSDRRRIENELFTRSIAYALAGQNSRAGLVDDPDLPWSEKTWEMLRSVDDWAATDGIASMSPEKAAPKLASRVAELPSAIQEHLTGNLLANFKSGDPDKMRAALIGAASIAYGKYDTEAQGNVIQATYDALGFFADNGVIDAARANLLNAGGQTSAREVARIGQEIVGELEWLKRNDPQEFERVKWEWDQNNAFGDFIESPLAPADRRLFNSTLFARADMANKKLADMGANVWALNDELAGKLLTLNKQIDDTFRTPPPGPGEWERRMKRLDVP